jgi:hypothetical protein
MENTKKLVMPTFSEHEISSEGLVKARKMYSNYIFHRKRDGIFYVNLTNRQVGELTDANITVTPTGK